MPPLNHDEMVMHRAQEIVSLGVMHGASDAAHFLRRRRGLKVEEGVGTEVAEQKRLPLRLALANYRR